MSMIVALSVVPSPPPLLNLVSKHKLDDVVSGAMAVFAWKSAQQNVEN
jgi:hypothetical protein